MSNPFIKYCIKGLEKAYIPAERVFATRRLVDGRMVHVRDPKNEYVFSMNTLMGLHCAQIHGNEVFLDVEADYQRLAAQVESHASSPRDIAATLWTGLTIGAKIPAQATHLFNHLVENAPNLQRFEAKALGWSIVACVLGGDEYNKKALALAKLAAERYIHPKSALVRAEPLLTFRKNWASFGAHSIIAYAFLFLARKTGNEWARDLGLRIARKIVQLQGPEGQWPWMYHVPSGRVVDCYPVYSVHQYAYTPLALCEAIDQGHAEFREPLLKGFNWIFGQNEIGQSMIEPSHHIIWRRVIRKKNDSKFLKLFRGASAIYGGLKPGYKGPEELQIDRQCYAFEMALPLYVFSGRTDFNEVLNDNFPS